jgi:ELWxxDGT repeat protein
VLVKDIFPGSSSSNPQSPTPMSGVLYFHADDGVHGDELWRSDGTAGGTYLLRDLDPTNATIPSFLTAVNGAL